MHYILVLFCLLQCLLCNILLTHRYTVLIMQSVMHCLRIDILYLLCNLPYLRCMVYPALCLTLHGSSSTEFFFPPTTSPMIDWERHAEHCATQVALTAEFTAGKPWGWRSFFLQMSNFL